METIIVPVIVALITAGIPASIAIMRMKRKNSEEHGKSFSLLTKLDKTVEQIDTKLDGVDVKVERHLYWHLGREDERRIANENRDTT